ncbi:MAG: DDE-type integrase/transposase/recombinase [Ahrensia sp.]|nr:DDE-type integrase/transposase/recombinase [Ahrensia sp.]
MQTRTGVSHYAVRTHLHSQSQFSQLEQALDVYTRKCVGWSVGLAENADDVRDALRVACMWNGIPAIFYVDRGPGFKNDQLDNDLTGFCARLGITKMHSLPYNSQARGIIERYNGSALNPLAKRFSTYIGADMDRQARQKSFKQTRKELAEFGTSSQMPTWQEFVGALTQHVAQYNETIHAGLTYRDAAGRKHEFSPNGLWQQAVDQGFEPIGVLPQEADDLFRPYVRRKTRRAMVSFITNSYFHLDLEPFDGLEILVGYDCHDASKVWCREIEIVNGEERPGRLIAVAQFEGNKERYVPLTAERHATEKRLASRLRRNAAHAQEIQDEADPKPLFGAGRRSKAITRTSFNRHGFLLPEPARVD